MSGFILIHFDPDGGESRYDLEDGRSYRLGAKDDNDIVIDRDDVSRHHAILRVSGETFHVTDLKSKNGTFINGNRADEAQFRAGDLFCLSSARLIVVEPGSDEYSSASGDQRSTPSGDTSNTIEHPVQITVDQLVDLLEITGRAVRHGAVAEPLGWAGRALGLKASVLLFGGQDDRISIVSSAGDLGPLVANSTALVDLVREARLAGRHTTRIKRFHEVNEDLLVALVDDDHILVVRYGDSAPAVGDIRALIASLEAVLGASSGREGAPRQLSPGRTVGQGSLDLDGMRSMTFSQGREHFEHWFVAFILDECSGNQSEAARRLGLSRAGLFKKLKKLGLKA